MSTKTHVVSVKRSVERGLRVPKDLGAGPFGFLLELLDAPFVGASKTGGEKRLLCVEDILESIHWRLA